MRIYLAGKLNALSVDYLKNVSNMIKGAEKARKQGHAVFNPCLDLLMGIVFGNYEYEDYVNNNMAWLEVADEVWVLPEWENSKGTRAEIERAKELNIPVRFM